jgi:effector-binding domain-containing protein
VSHVKTAIGVITGPQVAYWTRLTVDIAVKTTPSYKVASLERTGSGGSDPLRREFSELEKWAKKNKVKTRRWLCYFFEIGRTPDKYRFEACLEIKGNPKPEGKIKIKTLPKMTVASVKFNPDHVAPRLVYNGVYGWLDENDVYKVSGKFSREIYFGNPWTDSWAWARAEIQVPAEKKVKRKR